MKAEPTSQKHTPGEFPCDYCVTVIESDGSWHHSDGCIKQLNDQMLSALKAHVERCPMCAAGQECQDDLCYADRAAIAKAEAKAEVQP